MSGISQLAKLRAMSGREIIGRSWYRVFLAWERELHRTGALARPGRLRRGLTNELASRPDWETRLTSREARPSFFAGVDDLEATRALLSSSYSREVERARRTADAVLRHEIGFFGEQFAFGDRIDWHADPVTRVRWPRVYHADVPIHGGNAGFGDVKYVWELNRHQFLVDLAKLAVLDGSGCYASGLQQLIEDWLTEVPYATGVPWACALEPAFRVWSWLWAYHLLGAAGPLNPSFHLTWLTGFLDHGRFLYRHLERYSSPYNHLIGEAAALFALGLLFPEFREAVVWQNRGRRVLESAVGSQFHADGGTVEQSTFYHHATLGFYLLAAVLGRRNGNELSPEIWTAVERAIEFSMTIAQPDGRVPSIGGADDGKPIRLEHLPLWDFRPYQAIGAVLFARGDFKGFACRFYEDALWVLGSAGAAGFDRLPRQTPPTFRGLESSGYYVARTGWSADADYVCFDCGEQAAGLRRDGIPSTAHGHADCLSVVVTLGGLPVLADPGFFCYNGDPAWEVHFRKTRAHNTLTVDDRDQAQHVSKMAWTHTYAPTREGASGDGALAWAKGSHDGYMRLHQGVVHRRTIWLRPDGYLVLFDEITGGGTHQIEANFQFAPGSLKADGSNAVVFNGRFELVWICSAQSTAAVMCGAPGPAGGWVARSLGVREPAPRLSVRFPFSAPRVALLTIIADRERTRSGERRVLTSPEVPSATILCARVRGTSAEDLVLACDGRPIRVQGIDTDSALVAVRVGGDRVVETAQVGGTYLRFDAAAASIGAGER